jgi:hypothetical protein
MSAGAYQSPLGAGASTSLSPKPSLPTGARVHIADVNGDAITCVIEANESIVGSVTDFSDAATSTLCSVTSSATRPLRQHSRVSSDRQHIVLYSVLSDRGIVGPRK